MRTQVLQMHHFPDGWGTWSASLELQKSLRSVDRTKRLPKILQHKRLDECERIVSRWRENVVSLTVSVLLDHRQRMLSLDPNERFLTITEAIELSVAQKSSRLHDQIYGVLALTESVLVPNYDMPIILLFLRVLVEGLLKLKALSVADDVLHEPTVRNDMFVAHAFVEALLFKMELSPLHLTTALISVYATGVCALPMLPTPDWSIAASKATKFFRRGARFRATPMILRWCWAKDRQMSVPGSNGAITGVCNMLQ